MEFVHNLFLAAQILMYRVAEGTGALSVHDADGFQMGKIGVVQVFIQLCDGLVGGQTQKVDLRGDGRGFPKTHGTCRCDGLSFRRRRL